MAGEESAIKIDGLNEFRRSLRELDRELPKALRIAFNASADGVVTATRKQIPHKSGKAAASVRARSTQTSVRVSEGGARAPYTPWLDYGGTVGRKGSVRRPFFKKGRYLYPTYFRRKASGEIQRNMEEALLRVADQAGLEAR